MLSVYDNIDGYSKSNISLTNKSRIKVYDKTRLQKNLKYIDIGYLIMNKKILNFLSEKNFGMESQLYPKLIEEKIFHLSYLNIDIIALATLEG